MGETTGIAWTGATWNPWVGCTRVSEGCALCYMYAIEERFGRDPRIVRRTRPDSFNAPLRWARQPLGPRTVFTCSMSDFFHADADAWRPEAWAIIRETPELTYQVLTKRPERIADHLPDDWGHGYPNVWLGVSGETLHHAADRGATLRAIPARVRFLSAEPWLERSDAAAPKDWPIRSGLGGYVDVVGLFDWVIVGGESGANCRAFDTESARRLIAAANAIAVPVFLKQLGGHPDKRDREAAVLDGRTWTETPEPIRRGGQ